MAHDHHFFLKDYAQDGTIIHACATCGAEASGSVWTQLERAHAKIDALEALARQVAASRVALDGFDGCVFCGEQQWEDVREEHEPDCPVTVARRLVGEGSATPAALP